MSDLAGLVNRAALEQGFAQQGAEQSAGAPQAAAPAPAAQNPSKLQPTPQKPVDVVRLARARVRVVTRELAAARKLVTKLEHEHGQLTRLLAAADDKTPTISAARLQRVSG